MIPFKLILALISVESGGDPAAIGDGGRAVGVLQIHACVIADVNRVYKMDLSWPEDAQDPVIAQLICRNYLSIYAKEERLGREPTMEDMARIWNGGPNGYKKPATLPYWQKVQTALERR